MVTKKVEGWEFYKEVFPLKERMCEEWGCKKPATHFYWESYYIDHETDRTDFEFYCDEHVINIVSKM